MSNVVGIYDLQVQVATNITSNTCSQFFQWLDLNKNEKNSSYRGSQREEDTSCRDNRMNCVTIFEDQDVAHRCSRHEDHTNPNPGCYALFKRSVRLGFIHSYLKDATYG